MMKAGVFLTCKGDEKEVTRQALTSFLQTADFPYRLVVHCRHFGPEMIYLRKEFLREPDVYWMFEPTDLARVKAFNASAAFLMQDPEVRYLAAISHDMAFPRPWLRQLVTRLESDRQIGKLAPMNLRDGDLGSPNAGEREGDGCPWLMPRAVWESIGGEDENYQGAGQYADWDANRRIKNLGLKVLITPDAQILHHAESERWKYSTANPEADAANRAYYARKWSTDQPAV